MKREKIDKLFIQKFVRYFIFILFIFTALLSACLFGSCCPSYSVNMEYESSEIDGESYIESVSDSASEAAASSDEETIVKNDEATEETQTENENLLSEISQFTVKTSPKSNDDGTVVTREYFFDEDGDIVEEKEEFQEKSGNRRTYQRQYYYLLDENGEKTDDSFLASLFNKYYYRFFLNGGVAGQSLNDSFKGCLYSSVRGDVLTAGFNDINTVGLILKNHLPIKEQEIEVSYDLHGQEQETEKALWDYEYDDFLTLTGVIYNGDLYSSVYGDNVNFHYSYDYSNGTFCEHSDDGHFGSITFDAFGNIIKEYSRDNSWWFSNEYTYDQYGFLESEYTVNDTGTFDETNYEYEFDNRGHLCLCKEKTSSDKSEECRVYTFVSDENGRILKMTYNPDDLNESVCIWDYDYEGKLACLTIIGRESTTVQEDVCVLEYDSQGRLGRILVNGDVRIRNEYDSKGRLVSIKSDWSVYETALMGSLGRALVCNNLIALYGNAFPVQMVYELDRMVTFGASDTFEITIIYR